MGTEFTEFFVDAFITAVDLANVVDGGFAFGGECGDEEGHTGANVGGFEARAEEFAFAGDDDAVGITQDDLRAHAGE